MLCNLSCVDLMSSPIKRGSIEKSYLAKGTYEVYNNDCDRCMDIDLCVCVSYRMCNKKNDYIHYRYLCDVILIVRDNNGIGYPQCV